MEVGIGDIKGVRGEIPGGWEMIWVEDPWTGKCEKVWVPREEADYRRSSHVTLVLGGVRGP